MRRREFIAWLSGVAAFPVLWPLASRGQGAAPANQPAASAADNSIGRVASMTGSATVMRGNASRAALKVADVIYAKDILQTDVNSSLGITFDDETTFSLSANTRIVIDSFVYQEGGHGNLASFNVASGTASFIASLVAKTDDMKSQRRRRRLASGARPASSRCRRLVGKAGLSARSRKAQAPSRSALVRAAVSPRCRIKFPQPKRRAIAAPCNASLSPTRSAASC
jgi:hypothetical protein